jgi:hypothetical protein
MRQQIVNDIRQHWAVGLKPEQLVLQAAGLMQDGSAEVSGRNQWIGVLPDTDQRHQRMFVYLTDILQEACDSVERGSSYGTLRARLKRTEEEKALTLKRRPRNVRSRKCYTEPTFADKRTFISRWLPNSKTDHWKTHIAALTICIWVARQYVYMSRKEHGRPGETVTSWAQSFERLSEGYAKANSGTFRAMMSQR